MAKKLSSLYKKFLYGGESEAPSAPGLYGNVKTKAAAPIVPSTLDMIAAMDARNAPIAAKALREELVIPRADDVNMPEVKTAEDPVVVTAVPAALTPMVLSNPSYKSEDMMGKFNVKSFKQELANVESNGGNYKAVNPNSSASGKYQFLFNTWKDSIGKVTGVKTKKEFLNSPDAQEKFMDHYTKTTVLPGVNQLRKSGRAQGYSDTDIAKLIHFQGLNGAKKQLESGKFAGKTSTNLSVKEYLRASKTGK